MTPRRRHYEHCVRALAFVCGQMCLALARGKFQAEAPAFWAKLCHQIADAIESDGTVAPPVIGKPDKEVEPTLSPAAADAMGDLGRFADGGPAATTDGQ